MSIESMVIALNHTRSTGTTMVVLMGIANHDGDGGAWPSVATLMRYAKADRRTVQRAVEKLEKLHEIRRIVQGGGDHRIADHQRPNRYQFLLTCPPDCDRSSRHATRKHEVVELDLDPAAVVPPRGADAAPPAAPVPPKPSLNRPTSKNQKERRVSIARGACGHDLIDDRHCERGCSVAKTIGATA